MLIEEALVAHLYADSGVYALAAERGYPLLIPQDVDLPAWAYQRVSGPRVLAHDGPSGVADGRYQITAVAESYGGAKNLITAIRGALDGFSGVMGGSGGVRVLECSVESEYDWQGQITNAFSVRLDFYILYDETYS